MKYELARVLVRCAFLVTLAALAQSARAAAPLPLTCADGRAKGAWELGLAQDGALRGVLVDGAGGGAAYRFSAQLVNVPSPCLSCAGGTVMGTLDDGVGTGPDYLVSGWYFGGFLATLGRFEARILDPTGTRLVGRIAGTYSDDPLDSMPGRLVGRWRVCD